MDDKKNIPANGEQNPGEPGGGKPAELSLLNKSLYLVFIVIFSVLTVLFSRGIIKITPSFRDDTLGKPILPYYRAFIHYPREEVINRGITIFFFLITLYLCVDMLFLNRLKGWKKVVAVLLSVFLIIGGTEATMNYYAGINPEMHKPHPTLFWELTPDLNGLPGGEYVYTNSHGFRSPEISREKPPGQVRIMILGDSSAFGFRVKNRETFGAVLVKSLRQKYPGKDIRLINAAVAGWTTYQASVFMKEKGWKYSPDIVIVAFNNDPQDEWKEDVERAPSPAITPLMRVLYKSQIYLAMKKLIINNNIRKDTGNVFWPKSNEAKRRVSIKQFRNNFDSIIDGATDRGAKVIAVSMPLQHSEGFIMDYRNTQKKAVEEEDFPAIDFIGVFKKYPEAEVFMDIMHPTAKGHKIIGEKLSELIVKTGWLDK